ncbi:hypothetical protein [Bacillus manliponensis]|uniref:hypothetical protein n=1 Tax=Bacillus manliponensis TaxID=574376 RepID=UPI0035124FA6
MLYILFLLIPLLGVLWFVNFVYLIRNIANKKSIHNQILLGTVITFFFLFAFMYSILGLH